MDYKFIEGRLFVQRTPEERKPTIQRLNRIEGQLRGVRQMLEDDRYCLDEVQQLSAIASAVREVSLGIISDHLKAAVAFAVNNQDGQVAIEEMMRVLRAALSKQ